MNISSNSEVDYKIGTLFRFWAVLKLLALFEFIDNAEYYTAGSNACKDYMGELAPFAPERQLELFEEIGRIGQHQGPGAFFAVANMVQGAVDSVHPLRRVNVQEELDYNFVALPRPRRGNRQVRATLRSVLIIMINVITTRCHINRACTALW